jgi:PAS domain S-box-containing protein
LYHFDSIFVMPSPSCCAGDMPIPTLSDIEMSDLLAAREAFLDGDPTPACVRPMVLESWHRSQAHGIDPRRLVSQPQDGVVLRRAQIRASHLLRTAAPYLDHVHETLEGRPHVVALADDEGRIVRLLWGGDLVAEDLRRTNLFEGASWLESEIGCNGVGTALAVGEPVILIGPEHFQESYIGWTCIGVPVIDESGAVLGAFDLSLPNEEVHAHSWGWALTVVRGIEASLGRPAPDDRADAGRAAGSLDEPLLSVRGVLDALAPGLALSPTHARFLNEARADVDRAARGQAASAHRNDVAALLRERELVDRLLETLPVMIVVYDPAVREVSLNRHVERVLGWTNGDLEQIDIMEACYPDPDYRAQVRQYMESLEDGWRDFDMVAKDGSVARVSWANIRLTDNRQVGIGVDVTERRRVEQEIQQAYEDSRQALRQRDQILAVVSHDLRNPLNIMTMANSLLLEDIPEPKKRAQVEIIRRSVGQMTRLIEDLLDESSIKNGGLRVQPEPCDAAALVQAAARAMAPLAESRGLTLVAAETADLRVWADRGRVQQVFTNLISNAIEHTPEGGQVVVRAERHSGQKVRFDVRDTGIGIPADDLDRVFDRYWQSRKRGRAGAGLGLAIARGIVETHGGRIWVESVVDVGSTFSFTLPTDGP